jgi:hypothetical protein
VRAVQRERASPCSSGHTTRHAHQRWAYPERASGGAVVHDDVALTDAVGPRNAGVSGRHDKTFGSARETRWVGQASQKKPLRCGLPKPTRTCQMWHPNDGWWVKHGAPGAAHQPAAVNILSSIQVHTPGTRQHLASYTGWGDHREKIDDVCCNTMAVVVSVHEKCTKRLLVKSTTAAMWRPVICPSESDPRLSNPSRVSYQPWSRQCRTLGLLL